MQESISYGPCQVCASSRLMWMSVAGLRWERMISPPLRRNRCGQCPSKPMSAAVVHVGDSYPEDIEGARAVGIEAILIDRQNRGRVPYSPTISSLAELPALLLTL